MTVSVNEIDRERRSVSLKPFFVSHPIDHEYPDENFCMRICSGFLFFLLNYFMDLRCRQSEKNHCLSKADSAFASWL